jgi:hypothetical protein
VLYHLQERAIEHAVIPWCERHGVAHSPFGHNDFPSPRSRECQVLHGIADARRVIAPDRARVSDAPASSVSKASVGDVGIVNWANLSFRTYLFAITCIHVYDGGNFVVIKEARQRLMTNRRCRP